MRRSFVVCALFLLTSCGSSRVTYLPTSNSELPKELAEDCNPPVALKDGTLDVADLVTKYSVNGEALIACGKKHHATVEFYNIQRGDKNGPAASGKH